MKYFGYYANIGSRGGRGQRELHTIIEAPNDIEAQKRLLKRVGRTQEDATESGSWKQLWDESQDSDEEIFDVTCIDTLILDSEGVTTLRDESY